eukprot:g5815.t1
MLAGKSYARAIVVLLAASSCQETASFVSPHTTLTTTRAFEERLGLDRSGCGCCSDATNAMDVAMAMTPDGEERLRRLRGSSARLKHNGSSSRRGSSSRLWAGKGGKFSPSSSSSPPSPSPSEGVSGDRRSDGSPAATAAGFAQGSSAVERGGGAAPGGIPPLPLPQLQQQQAAAAAASERVLGAEAPVATAVAGVTVPSEVGGGNDKDSLEWSEVGTECQKRVYICTNRWCMEKGSSATLGSFVGLAPEGEVLVQGVNCLGRCNKGPNVRVRQESGNWLEFNRIENVERVYKILRDYLGADVSKEAALCLKYNFLANAALDRNEVTLAIDYYDKALATGYADQQGVLLVMRATAFIQRAYSHGRALTDLLQKVVVDMPTQTTLEVLHELWEASGPSARMVLLGKFAQDCEGRGSLYQKTKFRYGLYEFALLR